MKLRTGGWRENEDLPSGTIIPGEVVAAWPLPNRLAMSNQGRIRFFMSETEALELAPVMAEQLQSATAQALHEAEEAREAAETGQPTALAIRMAAVRAAKALKGRPYYGMGPAE